MPTVQRSRFGELLRQHRRAAGLTQAALAERSGIDDRTISNLERGERRAVYRYTVAKLMTGLSLSQQDAAEFERVAALQRTRRPRAASPSPHRLPSPLPEPPTPLIGRERDEADVVRVLQREEGRLVTLSGPGGVGKTRLAVQVATGLRDAFPDGVVFVALAAVREPDLVAPALARPLGLREAGSKPVRERLIEYLRDKHLLLLLDNFETVAPAATLVADVLGACPRLRMLVTSRAAVHVRGEQEYPVAPLATPDAARLPDLEALARYGAIRLFVQRAGAVRPDFRLTTANAPAVAAICHRLDGLPLAIELAAARIKLLPPQALLARLERPLQLLTNGPHDLPPRHQTLRDTVAWSYDLLTAGEQALFRRLCVFVGGCTLEAAQAVCGATGGLEDAVLDGLVSLVDKNLLRREGGTEEEPRCGMLETIREYGLERLTAGGEAERTRDRHAAYFLSLVEEAGPALTGPEPVPWFERLEREHDNLRAALRWAIERGETERGLRLADELYPFWHARGYVSEGRAWLERLLALAGGHDGTRAKALVSAGTLAMEQGDYGRSVALCDERLALARHQDDRSGIAAALNVLGSVADHQGDYARAATLFEESLAIHRRLTDKRGLAGALKGLGLLAMKQGDYARAVALSEESLALLQEVGDARGVGTVLNLLGHVAMKRGDYGHAAELLEESVAMQRRLTDRPGLAVALVNLGIAAAQRGDLGRAVVLCEESLPLLRELGEQKGLASALNTLGGVALQQGDNARAVALFEECLALFRTLGDRRNIAVALNNLAYVANERGDYGHAAALHEEGLAIKRELGDKQGIALALNNLGDVTKRQGDLERAAAFLSESLMLNRELGNKHGVAMALLNMGKVAMLRDDYEAAAALCEESLALAREVGVEREVTIALGYLGAIATAQADDERAAMLYRESLARSRAAGDRAGSATCLEGLASVSSAPGRAEHAARLFGAAARLREVAGTPLPPIDRAAYDRALAATRAMLGDDTFAAAYRSGGAMPLETVISGALGETCPG